MTVSAPPRPPAPARTAPDSKPLEREEIEALVEALIEEARRETRRRHRRYWALAALATFVGVVVLILLERGAASQTASPALSARSGAAGGTPSSKIAFLRAGPAPTVPLRHTSSNSTSSTPTGAACEGWPMVRGRATTGATGRYPIWSPDGRKLVFAKRVERSGAPCRPVGRCNDEIYVINADGTGLRRLDAKRGDRRPPRLVTGRGEDRVSALARRAVGEEADGEYLRDERRRQRPAEADATRDVAPGASWPGRPRGRRSRSVHQPVISEPRTSS